MGSQRVASPSAKSSSRNMLNNPTEQLTQQHKENVSLLYEEWEKVKSRKDIGSTFEYKQLEKGTQSVPKDFKPFNLELLKERRRQSSNS